MPKIVEIALSTPVGENGLYHYEVPDEWVDDACAGVLAQVPFGARELTGVIFDPDAAPLAGRTLKPIKAVLDPNPVVTPAGIAVARWIGDYYNCPIPEVLAAMLPPGVGRRTAYRIARLDGVTSSGRLTEAQRRVLDLVPPGATVALDRLTRESGKGTAQAVASLVKRGLVARTATLSRMAGPKTIRTAAWTGQEPANYLGPKGRAVLAVLRQAGAPLSVAELGRHVAGAAAALPPLQRQGLVTVAEEVVRRDPVAHRAIAQTFPLPLTGEQRRAVDAIIAALRAGAAATFLLHGVTGSGKTEVYLQALAETIELGRQGVILVPEISLTPQTMDRFAARFPGRVALMHSGLSEGERLDEWERVRTGQVDAVVGARSAIFTPVANPGLIVLDEEHDSSYKQDRTPRYHTREVARRLAEETGAVVVLGSATPDVTSYYLATHGTYRLLEMTHRAVGALTPHPEAGRSIEAPSPLAPPAPSGGAGGDASPQTPAKHTARASRGLDMGDDQQPPHAPRLAVTPAVSANADSLTSTLPTMRRGVFMAGVWGEASPQAPLEGAGGARGEGDFSQTVPSPASGRGGWEVRAAGLPPVEVVDLRQELHAGNRGVFSRALQGAMREALARREQIILFLNRRGSATFVNCRDCGFVARCLYCDLPYTYHGATEELVCHRCDDRIDPPKLCRRCNSWRIRYFGLGTQRVEEETRQLFPGARLLRWDRDVIAGRHGHEHTLDRFARGGADILVGTQMVAKGLDIPRVTVVGVISADTALNLPDFRAAERTFQTLTQVAGRAGRHALPGRVVVQTYAPEHFAIDAASMHDYTSFYEQEIRFRQEAGYPPFARLLRLVYSDKDEEACRVEGERLAARLRAALTLVRQGEVVGPAPCFIGKIEGRYLWQVLVRADDVHPLLPLIPPGWTRDVDPMSLL